MLRCVSHLPLFPDPAVRVPMVPIRKTPRGWRCALAGFLTASAMAAAVPSAGAAVVYGDQVDRGDGISGFSRWLSDVFAPSPYPDGYDHPAQGVTLSDDGRYAWLTFPTSATTRGLYRRDISLDKTTLMVDDVTATGATAKPSGRISVITKRGLVAADQNGTADLYLIDAFTGTPTLASTDASGAAIGGIEQGLVTRDGSAVLWSKAGEVSRRVLGNGGPVSLGAGAIASHVLGLAPQYGEQPPADLSAIGASADGRTVVLAARKVLTPGGIVDVAAALPSTFRPNPYGLPAFVTPDGAQAVVGGTVGADVAVAVVDLATSQARIVRPTGLPSGVARAYLRSVGPVAGKVIVELDQANRTTSVALLDLGTGVVTKVSGDYQDRTPTSYSLNGRYGLATSGSWLYAVPVVANATLPGGPGSAPATYVSYVQGCRKPVLNEPYGGRPTVRLSRPPLAPPSVQSMTVAARNLSNGVVMNRFTLTPGLVSTLPINGYYGAVRLEVSLRYTNGQVGTNQLLVPTHEPPLCYGNFGF